MQLTNEKLVELIQQGILPKIHLETLYFQNESFINIAICKAFGSNNRQFEDLKQESYITLCECVEKFDGSQGIKFISYFGEALKNMFPRYSYKTAAVKVSANTLSLIAQYEKATAQGLTDNQIAVFLNVPASKIEQIKRAKVQKSVVSLDMPLSDETDSNTLGDTIAAGDSFEDDVIKQVDNERIWDICRRHLQHLQTLPSGYEIIWLYYKKNLSTAEIGQKLNLTVQQVDRKRKIALSYLRRFRDIQAYDDCIYRHTTLAEYKRTFTSSTEAAALFRVSMTEHGGGALLDDLRQQVSHTGGC